MILKPIKPEGGQRVKYQFVGLSLIAFALHGQTPGINQNDAVISSYNTPEFNQIPGLLNELKATDSVEFFMAKTGCKTTTNWSSDSYHLFNSARIHVKV